MSFAKQLYYLKHYQRDFKDRFGKALTIDFQRMKQSLEGGLAIDENFLGRPRRKFVSQDTIDEAFQDCISTYNADPAKMSDHRRFGRKDNLNETMAMAAFCARVISNGWHVGYAATLIKRDRATIYHFAKKFKTL